MRFGKPLDTFQTESHCRSLVPFQIFQKDRLGEGWTGYLNGRQIRVKARGSKGIIWNSPDSYKMHCHCGWITSCPISISWSGCSAELRQALILSTAWKDINRLRQVWLESCQNIESMLDSIRYWSRNTKSILSFPKNLRPPGWTITTWSCQCIWTFPLVRRTISQNRLIWKYRICGPRWNVASYATETKRKGYSVPCGD